MTERFAIYYAPERGSALDRRADAWLAQEDLLARTVSARRYGFHATIKAPMALAPGYDRAALEMALANFARTAAPVDLGRLAVTPTDRLPEAEAGAMRARAADWFAETLAAPVVLDRLVLFHEAEPGSAFRRL